MWLTARRTGSSNRPCSHRPCDTRLDPVRLRFSRSDRILRFIAQKPTTIQAEPWTNS